MKNLEQTLKFINAVAAHQGWVVNGDADFLSVLAEGLTANYKRYGYYLCPCRDGSGIREKDKDIICPCRYAADDIREFGHCYCALYQDRQFELRKKEISSIPERRDPALFT